MPTAATMAAKPVGDAGAGHADVGGGPSSAATRRGTGPRAANAGSADAAEVPDFAADSAALPTARAVTVRSPTTAAAR